MSCLLCYKPKLTNKTVENDLKNLKEMLLVLLFFIFYFYALRGGARIIC
jgi:hypothetical protein